MKKLVLLFVAILWFGISNCQEKKGNNFYLTFQNSNTLALKIDANIGYSKSVFNNSGEWAHGGGYAVVPGIGVSYMLKNSYAFDASFNYEMNSYVYGYSGFSQRISYRSPMANLRFKKMIKPEKDHPLYAALGAGYMFSAKGTESGDQISYSYTTAIGSGGFLALGEFGLQTRFSPGFYMDFGIVYKYGFGNVMSATLSKHDLDNVLPDDIATASTKGNYLGLSLKFYPILKMWPRGERPNQGVDKRF